jgi:uncharacterized protein YcbK (DUF882 family)
MKDISELNPKKFKTNPFIEANLKVLFDRMMELQGCFGHDLVITSGLRDASKQLELIKAGKSNALHSKHLAGAACDVYDPDKKLAEWCRANVEALKNIGLWCEDFDYTKNWAHFQIFAPLSGKRFFIP